MTDYRIFVEKSNAGMFVFQNKRFTYVNEAFVSMFGFVSPADFLDRNVSLQELMTKNSYQILLQEQNKRDKNNDKNQSRYVIECYHQEGKSIFLELFTKTHNIHGQKLVYGTAIDVTESTHVQEKLYLSEQRYRSLFEYNTNLIYSFDLEDRFVSMNPAVTESLGYNLEELININFQQFIHPNDLAHTMKNYQEVKLHGEHRSYETRIIHKSGEIRHTHIVNIPFIVNNEIVGIYGIARDITELKSYVQQMEYHAFTDHLTGLPNRRDFEKKFAELHAENQPCSLAIIDLDGFKTINDTLGHDIGDELLKKFSCLLMRVSQGTSVFVARLGGDEFALIYPSDKLKGLLRIAEEILGFLRKPLFVKEFEVFISASIGVSSSDWDNFTPLQLFRHADIALYSAKSAGKRVVSVYSESHDVETLKKFTLVRDIQKAITDNQFYVEYQPRYHVKECRVTSVEALVRWRHPSWGIVSPAEFIPIAEESGLIIELGKWVLQTACREFKSIAEQLNVNLSVNVSVIQIMNKDFIHDLKQILQCEEYPSNRLELEITESALYTSEEMLNNFLWELKALNIQVSLDDFGTGYSSLSFIQNYVIDTVKLDRSFIASIKDNEKNAKMFSGIVTLLQSINLKVVAEGIETKEQYAYLTKHNCDEAQGYLFSKPVSVDVLRKVIQKLSNILQFPLNYSGEERKELFRVGLDEEKSMKLKLVSIKGESVSTGQTTIAVSNIGQGGLSMSLGVNLPISPDIIYQFTGNVDGEELSVFGHVVWANELDDGRFQYGVTFIQKQERGQLEFIQLINRLNMKMQK